MQTEIEAKWLAIDHDNLRVKLTELGAELKQAERLMRRKVYDYADKRLAQKSAWVRVRDEGDKTTLSYKQLQDRTVTGTGEITLKVDSFESADAFLQAVGLQPKSYQETKRESWVLDGVEIELDTWPWIPSFVELEAKSEADLAAVAKKLGLDYAQALHGSVETAYQAVYDVTEEEIDNWQEITFSEVPAWLEQKRI